MNTALKISQEQVDSQTSVFHLNGWLDAQSEETLIKAAQDSRSQGVKSLVLDLEEISMLTSAGIRSIQKIFKNFTESQEGLELKLCNAPPNVYHVLKLTGILQMLPIYESLQAALET
jgi:anti-anti-sigma factor